MAFWSTLTLIRGSRGSGTDHRGHGVTDDGEWLIFEQTSPPFENLIDGLKSGLEENRR